MNGAGLLLALGLGALMLSLPRRFAPIPLLIGALLMTRSSVLEIGPADFSALRLLVAVGFVRAVCRGETVSKGFNAVDRLMILWAVVLIGTSAFHTSDAWVFRAGLVGDVLGTYFLFRMFIGDPQDVERALRALCMILLPLAVLMLAEKLTGENPFSVLGGVPETSSVRNGQIRATGSFAHPILAGTVAATSLFMAIYVLRRHWLAGTIGLFSSLAILYACTSSGPIMMALFILFGMLLWRLRQYLILGRWLAFALTVLLAMVMKDPVYFLIARVDITGGSQGYYRAQLIRSSIQHLDEWWAAGTDYTRHWMHSGIYANANHADITNHILAMGVMGGLPLMIVFVLMLVAAFRAVDHALRASDNAPKHQLFLIWTLGALLFGHIVNFVSISLFDQSIVFFNLVLAAIGAVQVAASVRPEVADAQRPAPVRPLASVTPEWRERMMR